MYLVEIYTKCSRYVRGKKTYLAIIAAGAVELLSYFNKIDEATYLLTMKLTLGLAAVFFINKMNRGIDSLRKSINWLMRSPK